MGKIDKSNLGYLGADYQYRLAGAFINDPKFFKKLYPVIEQNAFTEAPLRVIVGIMKDHFFQYGAVPSADIILIEVRLKISSEEDVELYDEVMDRLKHIGTEGIEAIKEHGFRFFMQQSIVRAANKILKIAGDGDAEKYGECRDIIEKALTVENVDDDISSPFESIEDDLSSENVVTIPTGINRLDKALGGGLDKGKMGVIIGPTGFGKTSMTTCIAANAATYLCEANDYEGFKVLQIVFEDTHRDLHRKYIAKVSQVESCRLNESEETTAYVKSMLSHSKDTELINENIRIVRLPSGEKSATDIKMLIKNKINGGFKPDMVILDYFECLAPENGYSKSDITDRESKTMRKLEVLAPEIDVALWVTTQGNRESIVSELVTLDKSGGSIKKVQISQVVISISRSIDDAKNKLATIALLKNRSGMSSVVLNGVHFDNGTCTITTEDPLGYSFDDELDYQEYAEKKEEEIVKTMKKSITSKFNLEKSQDEDFPM